MPAGLTVEGRELAGVGLVGGLGLGGRLDLAGGRTGARGLSRRLLLLGLGEARLAAGREEAGLLQTLKPGGQ